MDQETVIRLLKKRPGYEVVYLLLQSDQRRKQIAVYVGTDGGTLQRWLDDAEEEGLISKQTFLHNEEKYVEYSLASTIPSDLRAVIEDRGESGPRDTRTDFANTASIHRWNDPHEI